MSILDWDPPMHRFTNVAPPLTWWWLPPHDDRAHAVLPDGSTACGHTRWDAQWRLAKSHTPRCQPCRWLDGRGGPC